MNANASAMFDPWLDAQRINQRLRIPGALLTVGLGAEGWCERCIELRPVFEKSMDEQETRLWLDLDEHAELIGHYVPEDLPMVLQWRDGHLVRIAVLEGAHASSASDVPTGQLRELPLSTECPNLWLALTSENWAQ